MGMVLLLIARYRSPLSLGVNHEHGNCCAGGSQPLRAAYRFKRDLPACLLAASFSDFSVASAKVHAPSGTRGVGLHTSVPSICAATIAPLPPKVSTRELQRMLKQKGVRSPRFNVPNNEQAVVLIGAQLLKGTLNLLSLTGGTVRLQRRFGRGASAGIAICTASGTFSAAIEFLDRANGNAQAFRFVAMGPAARGRLVDQLARMCAQGLAIRDNSIGTV